jgi:CheY-like chemotaxis protein
MRSSFPSNDEQSAGSILVVDDDEAFGEASAKALRGAGYSVQFAPDYRLALQHLESDQPIDLLITDIVMPRRVNGLALGRMARLRRPDIKILYLTAYDIPGIHNEALGPLLRKPIDIDEIITYARRVLEH